MIAKPGTLATSPVLHVVAVVSNPARFHSRYRLFREFEKRMLATPGVHLVTVELAYGDRSFEVTSNLNPDHVQLRANDELWAKENLINIGVSRLPSNWEYVAWVDADVEFMNPNWVQETLHQLQTHSIVQMFHTAADLGPRGEIVQLHLGFAYQYVLGSPRTWRFQPNRALLPREFAEQPYMAAAGQQARMQGAYWHPGFAWACDRETFNALGGLIDWAILGAGDHHMALSLIGEAEFSIPGGVSEPYRRGILAFQDRATSHVRGDVGYVDGTILHHWHGKKGDRKYLERWTVLIDNDFDPSKDIKKDWQGIYQLEPGKPRLRDQIRQYFRQRNEDSVDL